MSAARTDAAADYYMAKWERSDAMFAAVAEAAERESAQRFLSKEEVGQCEHY